MGLRFENWLLQKMAPKATSLPSVVDLCLHGKGVWIKAVSTLLTNEDRGRKDNALSSENVFHTKCLMFAFQSFIFRPLNVICCF